MARPHDGAPADEFAKAVDSVLAAGSPGALTLIDAAERFLTETLRWAIADGLIDDWTASAMKTIAAGPPLEED